MKTQIFVLTILTAIFAGCETSNEKPSKEDFDYSQVEVFNRAPNNYARDLDGDGIIDAITYDGYVAAFYVPGYEDHLDLVKTSQIMTPEMRDAATQILVNTNKLLYERARIEWENKILRTKE